MRWRRRRAGAGLWTLQPAQGQVTWEASLAELLGYQAKDFPTLEGAWRQLFHPDDLMRFEEGLTICRHDPKSRQVMEARLRQRDGNYRWLQLTYAVDATAAGVLITGTATDLTRVKVAEENFADSWSSHWRGFLFCRKIAWSTRTRSFGRLCVRAAPVRPCARNSWNWSIPKTAP